MRQQTRTGGADPDGTEPEQARQSLRAWADEVKGQQLQEAIERLEAQGQLSGVQRRILEEMSTAIVDDLLANPERNLSGEEGGQDRTETVLDLFDCGEADRS